MLSVGVMLGAVLAGCSGSPSTSQQRPVSTLPAAEPAVAPRPTVAPAGTAVMVGAQPEGVVADPVTHLVAVGVRGPNAVVLVDDRTGRIVDRVALPGHLRHLQLAAPGGPVLVPDESSNSLLTIALPDGTITSQVPTGRSPHDANQAANGMIFIADEAGASVTVIHGGQVVHTFTDVTQPAGVASVGTVVGLLDVRQDNLHIYNAATLTALGQLPAGAGPTHVAADRRGQLAVIDTRGNAVLFYALTPRPHQIGRLALPGTPYGVTYDPIRDRLWVTLTATNQVVGINPDPARPSVMTTLPTVRQPNTVAVDSTTGRLFVTGTDDGVLELIDP